MALRQDLTTCIGPLEELVSIVIGRGDLTALHEKYMHECYVHNDPGACENSKSVLRTLQDRKSLNYAVNEYNNCMDILLRRHARMPESEY